MYSIGISEMRVNLYTAFYAGFVALYAQTLMLRTALTLFDGNELVTGLFLALWMLLTAAGARIKPAAGREWPAILTAAMALLLPLAETLVPSLFQQTFIQGSMPALHQTALFFLGWIAPFCLLSGMVFGTLVKMAPADKIYAWETLGSLAGGISALLLPLLQPSSTYLPYFPATLWPLLLWGRFKKNLSKAGLIVACSLLIVFLFSGRIPSSDSSISETPQGRLQKMVYEGDTLYRLGAHFLPSPQYRPEEASQLHFALMQAPSRPLLLIIGPLNLSLLSDATKYQPLRITWLDTSPFITRLILQQSGRQIPAGIRVLPFSLHQMQGLNEKFDAMIVMNGIPSSLESSRWLTEEFILRAHQVLAPTGILCLNLPAVANYYSSELLQIHGSVVNVLRHHFLYVRLIAATGTYALASDRALDISWETGLEKAGRFSAFVNPWFFSADELNRRSAELSANLPGKILPATINRPIVFALYQSYWIHLNQAKPLLILAGLLMLTGLAMRRSRRNDGLMFAVSFVTASLQLVLLFLFQVVTGKIYLTAGFFFALFMAGLAAGSVSETRFLRIYYRPLLILLVIAVLSPTPFLITKYVLLPEFFYGLWAALFLVAAGWITGYLYRLYSLAEPPGAARLYAADLSGGAAGSLLTALMLVPLLGIAGTLILLLLTCITILVFSGFRTYNI